MKAKVTIKRMQEVEVETKYGKKPKINMLVKTEKGREVWVDGFANAATNAWKEGDQVEVELTSREYKGKTYWNFKAPRVEDLLQKDMQRLIASMEEVKAILRGEYDLKPLKVEDPPLGDEPISDNSDEQVPF